MVKSEKATVNRKSKAIKAENTENKFPIVAIGASAGNLDAISALLKHISPKTGMAFIYVQHITPPQKSSLPLFLSKITKINVLEIRDMDKMVPNNLYIIPHNKIIKVTDGHIKLLQRPKNSSIISINVLFSSLAKTYKENTIGVILSGNSQSVTTGLKAIKKAGGITFAQNDSAQTNVISESASALGAVDYILSPIEIAKEINRIGKHGTLVTKSKVSIIQKEISSENDNSNLNGIFELLLKETGVDFSQYKMPTINRRLNHKMIQSGIKTQKEYLKLLSKKNNELELLYKDLLINVTSFFRDQEVFSFLKSTFLPKLLQSKLNGDTFRIWVPACSTGEEAYTIAMIIADLQEKKSKKIHVQIFATDLSERVISIARKGEYTSTSIKSIPKKYIDRYFTKTGENFRICKEIREMCLFAPHNILRDPPFSKMDFISCCNLLIYFDSVAQKKVFASFHFSLNDNGHLMLSKAESVGASKLLFSRTNTKFKIYSRNKTTGIPKILELSTNFSNNSAYNKKTNFPTKISSLNPTRIENAIDLALLSHYMPACVVVNKDMEILQFRGPVSLYLLHSSGKATLNILKMARPEFSFELRNALNQAIKTKQTVYKSGIEIEIESILRRITLDVSPLKMEWEENFFLIVFTVQEQVEKYVNNALNKKHSETLKDKRITRLTEELNNARSEINSIIESQEITFEELQAANEEIVSTNEEFQTLNEELETSKEEIQASNEELLSSNHELQMRNDLLTESQEYSEAIITTIHEPMLVLYKNFTVKSANKSYYKKFLVKEEETEGCSFFELGSKQWNSTKLRKALTDVLSKNSTFENFEIKYTFPKIGEKVMLLNAHLITQKANSEKLIILAIADVTDARRLAIEFQIKESAEELRIVIKELAFQNKEKEKRAEELIIANKELHFQNEEKEKRAEELIIANYARSMIEASLDPLVSINADGKITDVNAASIRITGIKREKLIGTNFSNYFTDPEKAQNGYINAFEKGFVEEYPLTIKHKNGTLTDVLYNASVYKDNYGKVIGVFAAARDVTEQKMFEANLEKSLREVSDYKYALDEFSIVAITDKNGIITHANDNFCKISKYSRKELLGKDHRIINSGYHPKEFMIDLWTTITAGKIWRGELKNKAKDGTIYWVNTTIVPFLDEQKNPYQFVAVRTDITDQKRIANELLEAKIFAELATEIAEEAKNAAEKAAKIAEEAVKSKQQFLSNMSHEIRTPMNAIIGFTKVVLKTDLTAKQKEYLSAIKVSGDALIVLINDILDLAKVDAGKMSFEKIPFKMETSILAMLQLFETKVQEKNLELIKNYDHRIPKVLIGDSVRLHQIILNLVSNAVKFTNKGKISVNVILLSEAKDFVTLKFSVEDTGIGIEENNIKNIFENFQQATSETSRIFGGTGLGLAIVKNLIEAQGGSVNVKSKINEGSTFSFTLCFQKTNSEAMIDELAIEIDQEIKNIKVLVVEDIALNQLLMKTVLDDFGFERDMAGNGQIAIDMLQKKSYDIILMDLQMPEMNGFEATEFIRNTMKSKIPIIALTADVTTVDVAKCKAVGMNDYIAKPIDEKLLYNKIIELVKKTPLTIANKKEPTESKQTNKYVDLNYLMQRTKSNPKLMTDMISLYLEQTRPLLKIIKQSSENKNWDSLYTAVHKMIPSFAILGFKKEYENIAKKIQDYASTKQQIDEIPELVVQLINVCNKGCDELEDELLSINSVS
jgi:two-component system CheB/CheR fusion protein